MAVTYKNVKVRKKDAQGRLTKESEIINRDAQGNITPGEPRKTAATTDVSQPFKSSEFENLKEYEKAKSRASVLEKTPEQIQQEAVKKKLDTIAIENAVNKELLGQGQEQANIPAQNKTSTAQIPTSQVTTEQGKTMEDQTATWEPTVKSIFERKGSAPNGSMTLPETIQTLNDIWKVETKAVATAYSIAKSFFSKGGKSVTQQDYDERWGNLKSSIQTNLNLLSQGIGDYDTIQTEINQAEIINNKFEAAAHKASSYSLNYFATEGGADIEAEATLNKNTINNWRTELEQASVAAQLKAARAGL